MSNKEEELVREKANKLDLYLGNSDKQILNSITILGQIIGLIRKEQRSTLKVVLFNLFWSQRTPLLTPRASSTFGAKRYNPNRIGCKSLRTVLDKLEEKEFIVQSIGYKNLSIGEGNVTTSKRTPKLTAFFKENSWNFDKGWQQLKAPELVLLRSNKNSKELVDYKDTKYSNWLREELSKYNQLLSDTEVCLVSKDKNTGAEHIIEQYYDDDLILHRKFIDYGQDDSGDVKLNYGGRMYGRWCNLSSLQRQMLTLNGDETIELDLEASTVNVMYKNISDAKYQEGDPYYLSIDGKVIPRHIVKQASTIMLSTSSIRAATSALMNHFTPRLDEWVKDNRSKEKKEKAKEYVEIVSVIKPSDIMKAFLQKHIYIKEFYLKGKEMGDYVACMESDRVFEIIRQLTEKSIPVLTVYDAFIVQKQYEDLVLKLMAELPHPKYLELI
ncbi:hypothetical protein OAV81_05230 [Candidatus Thioglobus sp.]|nr:hypothetical protein [Candidatus Thioglobus sp.]